MAKIYGALEVAQLEWFTQSPDIRPSAASNTYRVIYASDVKQVQISDGTNWIAFINGSTNQTLAGNITFSGQQIFSGLHRLSVTTDSSSTGAITALNNTTPVIEFTAAVTSISGIANSASGATVMLVNRTGGTVAVLDEDAGATAANRIRTGTGAQISLANNASILLTYVGDSRWHVIGGSGSGSGSAGINYITNGSAEADTLGWAVYADAAGTSPVDGTGGSANVTITRSTTSPLIGTASFILTKDAANRQGQGWSYDFTIDSAYKAKVLQVSFQYLVDSGTFVAGSSTTSSDVTVWLYDITNAVVIQPSSFKLLSNNASISDTFNATFQTASNSTSYRLIFHVGSTSTSAYALKVDGISVSPSTYVYGTPVTDWQSYTPTGSWTANATYTGKYRRVGDSIEIQGRVLCSAAPTPAGVLSVNLPAGFSIDTNKINLTTQPAVFGSVMALDNGFQTYAGTVSYNTATSVRFIVGTNGTVQSSAPFAFGNTDEVDFMCVLPIVGLSSSVQTSDQTDTRVVCANVNTSTTSIGTSDTLVVFTNVVNDTHGAYSTSTGRYTVPVSGFYKVTSFLTITSLTLTTGQSFASSVYLDGVFAKPLSVIIGNGASNAYRTFGSAVIYANAGQLLDVRAFNSSTSTPLTSATITNNNASFERLSGPSAIAASETVALRYTNTAGSSYGTSDTLMPFATKDYDTHNAWVTNTFTAPISGKYLANVLFTSGSTGVVINAMLYKNGSSFCQISGGYSTGSTRSGGTATVSLNAGDTLSFYVNSNTAGSLSTIAGYNHFSITRVGN